MDFSSQSSTRYSHSNVSGRVAAGINTSFAARHPGSNWNKEHEAHRVVSAHPCRITDNFDLLNLAGSIYPHICHFRGTRRKCFLTERLLAGSHKDDVVSHQSKYRRDIALLGCLEPSLSQIMDRLFVGGHVSL